MLKKISLLASVLYTISLTALSLININDVVKDIPSFNDKVLHALVHFIFVILWFIVFRYTLNKHYNKAILLAALSSVVYGILIECFQSWITVSRQSDYNDVFANVLGMVFASILLITIKKHLLKNNNSLLF
ncbi:VanZ family protein [Lacinutrix venerupis]|uniref:VanZ family protein n=1 Tax=Lacinutrix venerupis TaxID=1486034 RepID=UPI000EADA7ED|nr:VanZ family protein [Lacinutrix venerupis]RLJ65721.1 VanZ family protein [Lacinutrix venerupis]